MVATPTTFLVFLVFVLCLIFLACFIFRERKRLNHCPDCGRKLGPVKENQNGWLYRECSNTECQTKAIGFYSSLES